MAYSRWSYSDIYSFWSSSSSGESKKKTEQSLAVWILPFEEDFCLKYTQVKNMIQTGEMESIPNFQEKYREELMDIFAEFVIDVDKDVIQAGLS